MFNFTFCRKNKKSKEIRPTILQKAQYLENLLKQYNPMTNINQHKRWLSFLKKNKNIKLESWFNAGIFCPKTILYLIKKYKIRPEQLTRKITKNNATGTIGQLYYADFILEKELVHLINRKRK